VPVITLSSPGGSFKKHEEGVIKRIESLGKNRRYESRDALPQTGGATYIHISDTV
jgi:hypothetical protein